MNILLLTGPAAAGKNTIANNLAQKREKCAVIDVDVIRWLYRNPHKAPWQGEEGKQQQKFGVENTCLLTENFTKNNIDVVILDVLVNETAKFYKEKLPDIKIVLLMPAYEEAHKRFAERQPTITEDEFKLVYKWQEELMIYDEKIDNTNLLPEEAADKLNDLF